MRDCHGRREEVHSVAPLAMFQVPDKLSQSSVALPPLRSSENLSSRICVTSQFSFQSVATYLYFSFDA